MKRKTALRLIIASGILILLGGGGCFFVSLQKGESAIGSAVLVGIPSLIALGVAVILGLVGVIALPFARRDDGGEKQDT
jgi:hypothetical protein